MGSSNSNLGVEETTVLCRAVDVRRLSREDQYDLFMFLIRASDEELIQHIKENPSVITAMMYFDALNSCDCSFGVEMCFSEEADGNKIQLLQRCIQYGLCPHILLLRHGYSEKDPLFYTDKLFEQLYSITNLKTSKRLHPTFSGLYWIHVVIISRKFDAVAKLLPVLETYLSLKYIYYTLNFKLSPLHLALLHGGFGLIDPLLHHFPHFIVDSLQLEKTSYSSPASRCIFIPEFLALHNKVEALKNIWPYISKSALKKRRNVVEQALMTAAEKRKHECLTFLLSQGIRLGYGNLYRIMELAFQDCDWYTVKTFSRMTIFNAAILINFLRLAIKKDNVEMVNVLMVNMCKSPKKVIQQVRQTGNTMFYAVLGHNSQIVSLLLKNKFYIHSRNCMYSLLKWTEVLRLTEIHTMLEAAGAVPGQTDHDSECCVITEIIRYSINTLENVKVLIGERGFDPNGDIQHVDIPPVYLALFNKDYDVVEYLLLNGGSLKMNKHAEGRFWEWFFRGAGVYRLWYMFVLVLVNTNAQFLVHICDDLIFKIICTNIYLLDILLRISYEMPDSISEYLGKYLDTSYELDSKYWTAEHVKKKEETNRMIAAWLFSPRSLKLLCRNSFRKHYGLQVSAVISSIVDNIPGSIVKFLNCDDVVDESCELAKSYDGIVLNPCGLL